MGRLLLDTYIELQQHTVKCSLGSDPKSHIAKLGADATKRLDEIIGSMNEYKAYSDTLNLKTHH